MAGTKALRKIQIGREATAGTEVDAGSIWRGNGTISDNLELTFPEEDIGNLAGTDRSYIAKVEAGITLEETPATFQQLPHILEMGVETATPSQDGAGSDYIYTYDFPTTSVPTIKTYTIEAGDNQQEEQFLYGHATGFTLTGNAGEAWNMSADIVGRQVATGTYTAALTPPTVETMLVGKTKLYIDDTGGTIGTTQVTNTLISATLNVSTGLLPKYTMDGNLYFSFLQSVMPEVVLDVTFEHNATAVTEKANWLAETAQLVRLEIEGSTFSTPGTTYSVHTVLIDLAGKWESWEAISDEDGNDVIVGHLRARYVSADSLFAQIVVVNELSSLP